MKTQSHLTAFHRVLYSNFMKRGIIWLWQWVFWAKYTTMKIVLSNQIFPMNEHPYSMAGQYRYSCRTRGWRKELKQCRKFLQALKVNAWNGISIGHLYGHFFVAKNVRGDKYLWHVTKTLALFHTIIFTWRDKRRAVFQKGRAHQRTMLSFLDVNLPQRWLGSCGPLMKAQYAKWLITKY